MDIMSATIPSKMVQIKKRLPWINSNIVHLIRTKKRLYDQAVKTSSSRIFCKYKKVRNAVVSSLRSAKAEFFQSMASNLSTPKTFWALYRSSSFRNQRTPATLYFNHDKANTNTSKAELLNSNFCSLYSSTSACSFPLKPITCSLSSIRCSVMFISRIKVNTATGPDGISSVMIKGTASSISPVITKIFNQSLSLGRLPLEWKVSNITPIFKSGDPSLVSNYRPISLLSILSKCLERFIHNAVFNYMYIHEYSLLSDYQFGFRPGSSTQDALLCITHDWFKQAGRRISTVAVFFDLSKAFDRVSHSRLLYYLRKIGITGPLHKWFSDYLSARKQRVVLKRCILHSQRCKLWSSPGFYPRSLIILYLHEWAFLCPTVTRYQIGIVC